MYELTLSNRKTVFPPIQKLFRETLNIDYVELAFKEFENNLCMISKDEVIEDKGVKVLIDPGAVMYLLGTEMDYKKEELSSTFVFKNPNETERCGCGESFKV